LFKPLSIEEMREIARLQLEFLSNKLSAAGINLEISEDAAGWLTKLGFDPQYGARPLKRAVQKHIANPLSVKLLASEYVSGDTIIIGIMNDGGFIFSKKSR
ncbi:MAG: ATP-dependent Clp protease ATP-binding subunit ClpB, partial [Bacteroidota bacterium]|nr:ATP-dependent Clp protease ATP-binding subunit ClpB [Bacteroidota bacterium]